MLETTRTYRATIVNHTQVSDDLDNCGHSVSKLWNVARYYIQQEWDGTGKIPSDTELKRELKDHERYNDLHCCLAQPVAYLFNQTSGRFAPKQQVGCKP